MFLIALLMLVSAYLFILAYRRVPPSPAKGVFVGVLASSCIVGLLLLILI